MKISSIGDSKEKRVAITPENAKKYVDLGLEVVLPKGIGDSAGFSDAEYEAAGARMEENVQKIWEDEDIRFLICVKPDLEALAPKITTKNGVHLIAMLSPFKNRDLLERIAAKGVNAYALEKIPRNTRAQAMDVLSSQANIVGYCAMVSAIYEYNKIVPLMMTAAGTVRPAKVLVIGAGVAGLQAIATAKRMGAVVEAFDVRSAAKEQAESLGATFIEVDSEESGDDAGGYAKEMSENYKQKQFKKLAQKIAVSDIVVTTAQIPGKPAPRLITADMVASMAAGSVIVDVAVETGGNCELSKIDKIVTTANGVKIVGNSNLAARVAHDASRLFARNVFNFVALMIKNGKVDVSDEIIQATLIKKAVASADKAERSK